LSCGDVSNTLGVSRPFLVRSLDRRLDPDMTNVPKDRHVVAAAVAADSLLVTFNLDDFSPEAFEPIGVEAIHPAAGLRRPANQGFEAGLLVRQAREVRVGRRFVGGRDCWRAGSRVPARGPG
jgi:hypothetical protein